MAMGCPINGKPYAGNPHVRFDEGGVASATPRRGSLLYNRHKTDAWGFTVAVSMFCSLLQFTASAEIPFSAIRLRKPQTDSQEIWNATLEQFRKYRAGVDDVWFSTGICYPAMKEHRANAVRLAKASDELRAVGILPSLQIQATLGHGDAIISFSDNSGHCWQTFVSSDGSAAKWQNCPRAPGFIAYMREMATIYATAMKPYSIWIDDDIRTIGHRAEGLPVDNGWGCHCDLCLNVFSAKEGIKRSRVELLRDMAQDAALAKRWRSFAFAGANDLVRTIGDAVHAVSPETRMCEQQPGVCLPEHRGLYEACHASTGLPVGMRPGAGSYFDYDPRSQIQKAYDLALMIDTLGPPKFVDRICPEIETCPRSFSCRSGRGVLLEALECLSQGMNSISALAIDAGFESPEWYGEEILAPLARNAAMLKRYVAANEGAVRTGYGIVGRKWQRGMDGSPHTQFYTASLPLKVLRSDAPSPLARIVTGDVAQRIVKEGDDAVRRLLADDILVDAVGADAFCRAGFSKELGIAKMEAFIGGLRERLAAASVNGNLSRRETPVGGKSFFLEPSPGAQIVGEYVCDSNPSFSPRPAAIIYENAKGRRRVVFGHEAFGRGMTVASAGRILQLHRLADWASHGKSPVVMESPTRSFVQPRTRGDGSLASVVFVNASIGEARNVKFRLRGVPSTATHALWAAFDCEDVLLPIERCGSDALVSVPSVGGWNGGYLLFEGVK